MKNFKGFDLHPALAKSLDHMGYTTPTPIQAGAIPLALKGRDIMGSAQTGTGKTAAYAIPAVQALLSNPEGGVLILTPTRELGKQVMEIVTKLLGPKSGVNTAFLIGGEAMQKQFKALKAKPRLVVGTPGRINDHLDRGSLKIGQTDFLVLDETDRMLDMGFSVQLDRIFKHLPAKRQTLMFSATLPRNILKLSEQYLTNPERIAVGSTIEPAKNIKQSVVRIDNARKYEELLDQLDNRQGSVIVFVKTKYATERLAKRLNKEEAYDDFQADAIHGDLKQSRRERVIKNFRDMKFRILFATDVAARGLDIPHIRHVINYDLPQVPEDYIHRIGRTARAGEQGEAVCFLSPEDGRKWRAIEILMDPSKKTSSGKATVRNRKPGKNSRPERPFGKGAKRKPFKRSNERNNEQSGKKTQKKSGLKAGAKPRSRTGAKSAPKSGAKFGKRPSSGQAQNRGPNRAKGPRKKSR